MKKTIKDLFKLITTIATVAGILYVARDQIKAKTLMMILTMISMTNLLMMTLLMMTLLMMMRFSLNHQKTTEIMFLSTSQILMMIHP